MKRIAIAVALVVLLFALAAQARAQNISIYVHIQNTDINGESTSRGHENWIDALSCSESVATPVTIGSVGAGGAGRPNFADVKILKAIDASSPSLREAAAEGTHIDHVNIEFWRMGGDQPRMYLQIQLDNVYVSEVSMTTQSPDVSQEIVGLAFSKITWTYYPIRPDGSPASPIVTFYDLLGNIRSQ